METLSGSFISILKESFKSNVNYKKEIVIFSHRLAQILMDAFQHLVAQYWKHPNPFRCQSSVTPEWESWFQQMELQKGDEEPAPSAPAASATQTFRTTCPTWQNSPSSFLLLKVFAHIVPEAQCNHSSLLLLSVQNTAPGSH